MFESIIAMAFVLAGIAAITKGPISLQPLGSSNHETLAPLASQHREVGSDLPCPWCRAQTTEHDTRCPSCGQKFG